MIPFVDLKRHHATLRTKYLDVLSSALDTGTFTSGVAVKQFETEFADYCQSSYCVGLASGTDALLVGFLASALVPGDEIVIPANTFFATVEAALLADLEVRLADVDESSGLMTPSTASLAVSPRTRAIVPVHLFGQPCDMPGFQELSRERGIYVFEDAAQAHGAKVGLRRVGSFGLAASFSFYPAKNLGALGEAGALVTNSEEVASAARELRDHGQVRKYCHERIGLNARLDEIQAGFLSVQLGYLDHWNSRRQELAEEYCYRLQGLDEISPLSSTVEGSVHHLFVVRCKFRNELREHLAGEDIGTGVHYPVPVHLQPAMRERGYDKGDFPAAETLCEEVLSLPLFPEMSVEDVKYVVLSIEKFLSGRVGSAS